MGLPRWLPWAIAGLCGAMLVVGWQLTRGATTAVETTATLQTDKEQLVEQRDATAVQALDLAALIGQGCATGNIPPQYVGACEKATQVKAEPIPGVPGEPGVDGKDGRDGIDGVSPPCLSEPRQCRGEDGAPGKDGAPGMDGAPGAAGVDGRDGTNGRDGEPCVPPEVRQPVTYADGQTGSGCVAPPPPAGEQP